MIEAQWEIIDTAAKILVPLAILFQTRMLQIWADKATKATTKVKETLEKSTKVTEKQLTQIQDTTVQTHILVNSQKGVILKNMAVLSRNHAIMARKAANLSNLPEDREIADRAEGAASEAENVYALHQGQQEAANFQAAAAAAAAT